MRSSVRTGSAASLLAGASRHDVACLDGHGLLGTRSETRSAGTGRDARNRCRNAGVCTRRANGRDGDGELHHDVAGRVVTSQRQLVLTRRVLLVLVLSGPETSTPPPSGTARAGHVAVARPWLPASVIGMATLST